MKFATPWALLLLLAVPLVLYLRRGGRGKGSVLFSSLDVAEGTARSTRRKMLWIPFALEVIALAAIAIALARPQQGMKREHDLSKGIAIEMLIDTSSSMDIGMSFSGQTESRLEVAKRVFEEFVSGTDQSEGADEVDEEDLLEGRPNDLIGLVTFARYADTICPATLGHDALVHFVRDLEIEDRPNEDGTAIGDALALAAARLKTLEEAYLAGSDNPEQDYEIKSKVIILLTDGENNCGRHLPAEGAALAKEWGIKIYAIGFGKEKVTREIDTPEGPKEVTVSMGADTKTLAMLADATDGLFRMAEDADSLRSIYAEINELETSEMLSTSRFDYRERFLPFALLALLALALEATLRSTWLRKIP